MTNKHYFYILLLFVFILIGCTTQDDKKTEKLPPEEPVENLEEKQVREKIETMTFEEKRGLLAMVSIPDQVLSRDTVDFLNYYKIGGVILFKQNIVNEKQLKKLTTDLREKVNPNLLIAIDQEGGFITRIDWDKYEKIGPYDIGKTSDSDYAYKIAYERALFLLDLGIDITLSPVADIPESKSSYIYYRSFSTNPEKAAELVKITVQAHKDAGIISVLKHFPGLGRTTIDSHLNFPIINVSKDELIRNDFLPFIRGIEAGAEIVMIGHVINKFIDETQPASISYEYVRLLRELGFNGIIMTDDLKMTGRIDNTIGWGINIITGSFAELKEKIITIKPVDNDLAPLVELVYFNN